MSNSTHRWWHNRANVALAVFVAIGGYFLWTEHRAHVIEFLPWILVLGCCGMHLFMHRGHGRGDHGSGDRAEHSDHDRGESDR